MGSQINPLLSAQPSQQQSPATGGGPTAPGQPTVAQIQTPSVAGTPLKIAQDLMAMTQARKNNAMQQLQQNISAREAGFPVDPNALVKLAKKAGLHFSTNEGDLQGTIDVAHGRVQGPSGQAQPQPQQQKPANNVQQVQQGKLSKKQQQQQVAEQWANNALQAAQQRGESATRMAQLANQVTDLKSKVLNGSPDEQRMAAGKLMAINEIPFTLDKAEWINATPEQKNSMIDIAAGHETDAQREARITSMQNGMVADGRFSDPEMAHKAAVALANNQPIPADVKATMKPFTASELTSQAQLAGQLVELGVPSSKLAGVMSAASVGGLEHALPTGLNPLIVQQIAQKNKEIGIEAARAGTEAFEAKTGRMQLGLEAKKYEADAAKVDAMAKTEENKEFMSNFMAIVDLDKAQKGAVPQDVIDSYTTQLAERSGLDVSEAKHWYQYVTGGHYLQFTPKPASDLANAAAGPSSTQNSTPQQQVNPKYLNQLPTGK